MKRVTSRAKLRAPAAKRRMLTVGSAFWRSRDGIAAAEFAISLMLLVLILFGIITFGWMFYQDNNWETAAREAARRLASGDALEVGSPVTCDSAEAQNIQNAVYYACNELSGWGATVTVDAASLCPSGDQAVRVTVSANAEDVAIMDVFGFFNGKTFDATVDMRQLSSCS